LRLATAALAEESGPVTVLVDSASAAESLTRAARKLDRTLEVIPGTSETVFKFGPR
jgi:D-serine deaminase-like pyridoxal phosphate-dependent protein